MIGFLVVYVFGIITAQYKIFPYKVVREIKQSLLNETIASTTKNNINISHQTAYHFGKKSFINKHVRNVEVVMLGDSITDNAEWSDLFPSKLISDQGISGDTTTGVLNRMDLVYKANPEKVFVMLGINDITEGKNINEIKNNYQKIVNQLVKRNIKVHIQSTLFVGSESRRLNNEVTELNEMLEKFSHTSEQVTYVDVNDALGNDTYLSENYSYDGLHLNGEGYKAWRDVIEPYIY